MGDLRYADAGVDIDEGNRAVSLIRRTIASTHTAQVLGGIGAFSGLFALEPGSPDGRVLASSTDSVAPRSRSRSPPGATAGSASTSSTTASTTSSAAAPTRSSSSTTTPPASSYRSTLAELIEGIAEACRGAGCALIGGETAEMPGVYALGDYDIAGLHRRLGRRHRRSSTAAGSRPGDVLLALPSSGLHTNGYSLVRHIVAEHELQWTDVLPGTDQSARRPPARAAPLLSATPSASCAALTDIRAMAHITGGGVIDNVPRVLPEGLAATIERSTLGRSCRSSAPSRRRAGSHLEEMWRTFNMGVGMVVIVPAGVPAIADPPPASRSGASARWSCSPAHGGSSFGERTYPSRGAGLRSRDQPRGAAPGVRGIPAFPAEWRSWSRNRRSAHALDVALGWGAPAVALPQADFGGDARGPGPRDSRAHRSSRRSSGRLRRVRPNPERRVPRRLPRRDHQRAPVAASRLRAAAWTRSSERSHVACSVTGCTVQLLERGEADGGPIVLQKAVPVEIGR